MARVRFTHDFDYKPSSQVTIVYTAGMEKTVRRECADKAIAAGIAVSLDDQPASERSDEGQS